MDPEVSSYKANNGSFNGQRRGSAFSLGSRSDTRIGRRHSMVSLKSLREKLQKCALPVPDTVPRHLDLRKKSTITISSCDNVVVQTYKKRQNKQSNEEDWADEFIKMFTMQETKLHVNDNDGLISLEESLERIENILFILSLILVGVATTILAHFDFSLGVQENTSYHGKKNDFL